MGVLLDLRQTARAVARQPGTALALLLSIGLGIGSNAAVFAFTTGLLSRTRPVVDGGQQVVSILSQQPEGGFALLTYPEYRKVTANTDAFELVAAARETANTVRIGPATLVASLATVTREAAELFALPTVAEGIVISETSALMSRRPALSDEPVTIDGVAHSIVGTAPEGLEGLYVGRSISLWLIVAQPSALGDDAFGRSLSVFARLRPGRSLADAQSALNAGTDDERLLVVVPYTGLPPESGAAVRRVSQLLSTAAAAVFLIACANVAVFLLSRAASQSHDTSIRVALGAGRPVLARGMLVQSSIVLVPGAAMGVLAALWTADLIPAMLFEQDAERLVFSPDLWSVVTAAAASAAITLCCGMVPLLENRQDQPAAVLRRQAARSPLLDRLQGGLVIFQMALCCTLIVSAASAIAAFRSTVRTASGEGVRTAVLATVEASARFVRPDLGQTYFDAVEQSVAALPGVVSTAWAARMPGAVPAWWAFDIERPDVPALEVTATLTPFTPASLDDMVMPLRAGRMFGGGDTTKTCRVAVMNSTAAAAFRNRPVGRVLEHSTQRFEVVGVVETKREAGARRAGDALVYYYPEQGTPGASVGKPVKFRSRMPPPERAVLNTNVVSGRYFSLMGLRLRNGRLFDDAREEDEACRVGVLNQQAADLYFRGQAVGGAVIDTSGRRTTIVGVIEERPVRATQRRIEPTIYLPLAQDYLPQMTLVAAGAAAPLEESAIERRVRSVAGGNQNAVSVMSFEEYLERTSLASERIGAVLVAAAASNAFLLGILGLYRATTDEVLRQQRDLAVRLALGAPRWRLVRPVLKRTGGWVLQGGSIGLAGAFAARRWLLAGAEESVVAWAWMLGPAVLLVGVLLASVLPVRRMLRVDPLSVMRASG